HLLHIFLPITTSIALPRHAESHLALVDFSGGCVESGFSGKSFVSHSVPFGLLGSQTGLSIHVLYLFF
ncbi:MAG TPA: hypothetical protein V6D20_13765, partial [Candidatus Obscuribacterales bacterium]